MFYFDHNFLRLCFNDVQLNRWWNLFLIFVQYLFIESVFVSLEKSVLLHRRSLMSKFSEMLILVNRKIFSAFYPILHETFSNSFVFPLMQEFNLFYPHLVGYDWKHFFSILTDLSNLLFLFHQKFLLVSCDVNVLTKKFLKMQKQPFANVLQKQSPRDVLRLSTPHFFFFFFFFSFFSWHLIFFHFLSKFSFFSFFDHNVTIL